MVFSFLDKNNIFSKYEASATYTDSLTEPFPEFERIARNKPKDSIPEEYPKTTDGTTASIIRKSGRRIVQQLPTGKIESDDPEAWLPIVAEFIYLTKILPYANLDYDLIQKCWSVIERGLTYGTCAVYTPFLDHDGVFTSDMKLIYWGNMKLQPGKPSGYACDYVFMREWWQKEDVDVLIERENKHIKEAKENNEIYEPTWDIEALKNLSDSITSKDDKALTAHEKDRNLESEVIEIVYGFQKGVGANFYVFNPENKSILRTKENRDPRGRMPIDWFYSDTDGENPLGRGVVELIGGMQNLIDSEVQMYQYNRALMLNPPIIKRGSFNKSRIKYVPNAIIDLGDDANASIDTLKIDTQALSNFPNNYGLMKSQMLNLISSPDTSISAEAGNPGFSKTHAGVQAQQETVSIDDNYLRKMFDALWENWSETAINIHFAEREGVEELQLDKKTADSIRKLIEEDKVPADFINEDDKVMIDYTSATSALKFRVDASSSKKKSDSEQADTIGLLLERAEASPILSSIVPQDKFAAAWNALVSASGVEDPENLIIDIKEMLAQQQAMEQQMSEQQVAEQQMIESPDSDQSAQMQIEQNAIPGEVVEPTERDMLLEQFGALGLSDDQLQEISEMIDAGYSSNEIMSAVMGEEVESDG